MADYYDLYPDLAGLLNAALRSGRGGVEYAERIAGHLGLDPNTGRAAAERALREALSGPGPRVPGGGWPLACARCARDLPSFRSLTVSFRSLTVLTLGSREVPPC